MEVEELSSNLEVHWAIFISSSTYSNKISRPMFDADHAVLIKFQIFEGNVLNPEL